MLVLVMMELLEVLGCGVRWYTGRVWTFGQLRLVMVVVGLGML